jgi:SAM-dependent methyltransferase
MPPPPPPPPRAVASSGGASGVELHYDSQACRHSSLGQALATRRSGVLFTYKRYANAVKRQLIQHHAAGARCLVDIGCGRGGDISKWRDAGVRRVVAMDLSAAQLDEARGRENDGRGRGGKGKGGGGTQIVWRQHSMLDPELASRLAPDIDWAGASAGADAVAAMFCIQFCFRSEATAAALLRQVSAMLRPGGIFFGTTPDAAAVLHALGGREAMTLAPPEVPFVLRLRLLGEEKQNTGGEGQHHSGGAGAQGAMLVGQDDAVTEGSGRGGCGREAGAGGGVGENVSAGAGWGGRQGAGSADTGAGGRLVVGEVLGGRGACSADADAAADRSLPAPAGELGHGLFFSLEDTVTQVSGVGGVAFCPPSYSFALPDPAHSPPASRASTQTKVHTHHSHRQHQPKERYWQVLSGHLRSISPQVPEPPSPPVSHHIAQDSDGLSDAHEYLVWRATMVPPPFCI